MLIVMKKISFVLTVFLLIGCNQKILKSKWTREIAPNNFTVRFETSKGAFDVEVEREWSPKAVDRFYQQVKYKFFENAVFYRVIPNFVAQFGSSDTVKIKAWSKYKIPDEKVILSNTKGTLSYARSTKETRGSELYFNLADNTRLDTLNYNEVTGFPSFGKVTNGLAVVSEIYSDYEANSVRKLNLLYSDRKKYLEEFSKLDTIQKVYFIK